MKRALMTVLFVIFSMEPCYSLQTPAQYMRLAALLIGNVAQQLKMYAARDATLSLCKERSPARYGTVSSQFTKFSEEAEIEIVEQELAKQNIDDPDTALILKVIMSGFIAGYGTSFNDELRYKLKGKSADIIRATCDNEVVSATNLMASK